MASASVRSESLAPADGAYESAALVQDALALVDALADGPVVLMGHDWGAEAAYGAAILAPKKVTKLITLAVPYGAALWDSWITNPAQQRRSWYIFFFQLPYAEDAVAHTVYCWSFWHPEIGSNDARR